MPADQPNILIVMTDHQRADTVLPEHPALTPNLDRFARRGVTFTQAYCPSPHCCPSRATFFTGLYPSGHGVWNNVCNDQALSRGLKPGVRLWSDDLADAGYDLHFVGKWHVSVLESPADRRWTEHGPITGRSGELNDYAWQSYQNLAQAPDPDLRGEGELLRPGYGTFRVYGERPEEQDYHDQAVLRNTLDLLPKLKGSEPWCLYAGFLGPHDPYLVPQKYLDLYPLDSIPLPESYADRMEDKPRVYQRIRGLFDQLSEREVREGIRHFWAYCTYLDDLFGQILDALESTGQASNTLVLYCSDHGDYCGEHGLFAKGIPCFLGAYQVPVVMRWPGKIEQPGRRVDAFTSLADFAPSFLEAAGLPVERHFAGASLLPFLRGENPPSWRDALFTQCNGVELYYSQRSVMTREHRYTFNGFDQDELYDLRVDPHEMVNRADDPAYAAVKRDLLRRLWQFAYSEGDAMKNPYITVGLAPYGPGEAFRRAENS